ncbi:hypothetical protein KGQ24_03685 [Patescibacteria group bacterium]|nr:hypothetical protein [Patescibacteria group bacterium]
MQINGHEINTKTANYSDFGAKNIALIAGVAVVLIILVWSQSASRHVGNTTGLSFSNAPTNLYASATDNQSKVLGASTYNQDLVNQYVQNIQIQQSSDTSSQALAAYANQMNAVLTQDNRADQQKFIADLKSVAAPSVLADYHKLTIAHYQLQFSSASGGANAQDDTALLGAVDAQLQQIRSGFNTSIGLNLP